MEKGLPFRQVHLDFHTGECVPNVAKDYTDEEFSEILELGNINSITLFAKCHHGMFYYYDTKFTVHPNLNVDLLPRMIKVCESKNIDYCVYISAGLDEYNANEHPEWMCRDSDGRTQWTNDALKAGYRRMCLGSPYLEVLKDHTEEIVTKFPNAKGYFLDITDENICYCKTCMDAYKKEGINPLDINAVKKYSQKAYKRYYEEINAIIKRIAPNARFYHNMGNVVRDRYDFLNSGTHVEIESLPTGQWGYDHFPTSASYVKRTGFDYAAHTGKFHTMWGDFGGFKHPNALVYETALHGAFGAKSIVGDQLHPSGKFDRYTYECIGKAYKRVKRVEEYLTDCDFIADVGVVSQDCIERSFCPEGDSAANRILLQGKFLYDVIDSESDFSRYKVIILPDTIIAKGKLLEKLQGFVKGGGKILASGLSGTVDGQFVFDFGAKFIGEDKYNPTYAESLLQLENVNGVKAVMYEPSYEIEATGKILINKYLPYFNREVFHFCSHLYTPYDPEKCVAGATVGKDGAYLSWNIFRDYARTGAGWMKEIVVSVLEYLLGENGRSIQTNLPSNGIITLYEQKNKKRFVNHILYATPTLRGKVQVIEDITPINNVKVAYKTDKKILKCYDAVLGKEIDFVQKNGLLEYVVSTVVGNVVIVAEY